MAWQGTFFLSLFISAAVLPAAASEVRNDTARNYTYEVVERRAPAPGYFGTFGPNAYDYSPAGYGESPPYGYGFPPYGYGCLQRTVVLTLFGPRIRSVWVCR